MQKTSAEMKYYNDLFSDSKNASFNLWKSLGPIINPGKKTEKAEYSENIT